VRDQHEAEQNGIIVYSDKSNYSLKTCYIPLNKLNGLNDNQANTISFSVKNHGNTVSEKTYLLDSEENHCDIFYDAKDQNDATVAFSATPLYVDADGNKFYGGSSFSEKIAITIKDDKGLKNYTYAVIDPNGKTVDTFTSSDFSSGVTTSETIETEVDEIVDGETITTTKSEKISYRMPITTDEPTITIDRSRYETNGRYTIKVEVTDLAGNPNDEHDGIFEFYIDNESPTVKEDKYNYNPSILKYLTFGIFGNDSVSLSVKVEDNESGCGFSDGTDEKVKIKWGEEEYKVSSTSSNGKTREFVFDTLPVNASGTAYFIIEDALGNTSNYYLTKSYNVDKTAPAISSSLTSNAAYYNGDQVVTITIDERNFRSKDVHFTLNGDEVEVTSWENDQNNTNVHIGKYTISKDGVYSYNISYTDMAGNHNQNGSTTSFVVDQTPPILKTNFNEFKTSNKEHYFGVSQIDKNIVITITEHNFDPSLAHIEIKRKDPGEAHDKVGMETVLRGTWSIDEDNEDTHIFTIPFSNKNDKGEYDTYDGIYVVSVAPLDKASNSAISQESVVFEIDFTKPIISQRNGNSVSDADKSYTNLEIFTDNTGIDEGFIPSVAMSDKNLERVEYVLTVYTPEYTNGKEIGTITPSMYKDDAVKQIVEIGNENAKTKEAIFTLPEFKKDGIYSFDLTAVDKAGNKSVLCRNTSVLMMNSDVLAYITESKKADNIKDSTGWYSLQKDEKTPISKRPDDFKDLKITVFAPTDSKTNIVLRDQNGKTDDTGLTADNSEDMYAVGVYNYTLPGQFFIDNYPEGTNKDIYLRAENTYKGETSNISLAWIRIDALAPTCKVPSDLKKGKAFIKNSKTYTITDISESLNPEECKVYDNGVLMTNFTYSEADKSLSYTLDKGRHDLSFVLVDEAGNSYTVQEVSFIQVGLFYCLWFRILLGFIIAILVGGSIWLFKKKKSQT